MKAIEFFIPMKPTAKGRPRMTKTGHVYTPNKTKQAEDVIIVCALENAPHAPHTCPVSLYLSFDMPIPTSTPKSRLKSAYGSPHVKKPDLDNMVKLVMDAITRTEQFWLDDSQVSTIVACKRYAEEGAYCGINIKLLREGV